MGKASMGRRRFLELALLASGEALAQRKAMANFSVVAAPAANSVVTGESLPVRTAVSAEAEGQVPAAVSPIVYELRQAGEKEPRYVLSQPHYQRWVSGVHPSPPAPERMVVVGPGKTHTFHDDLALYAVPQGIAPGSYLLTARLGEAAAPPVPIAVTPARFLARHTVFCPDSSVIASIAAHRANGGATALLQRDTLGPRPQNGVLVRRLERGAAVSGVAVAVHAGGSPEGRWFGWIEGDSFGAARGWGTALTARPEPANPMLGSPRLAQPGFHLEDESAVFIVAGLEAGRAMARAAACSAKAITLGPAVSLGTTLPGRILACASPGGAEIELVWQDPAASGTRVLALASGAKGPPRVVLAQPGKLLALEAEPIADGPARVHALSLDGHTLVFSGGKEESRFDAPDEAVLEWAISPTEAAGSPVLARTRSRLLVRPAHGKAKWVKAPFAPGPSAHGLQVVDARDRGVYAAWVDEALRFEPL
jgi:hypothetical protein